MSWTEDGCWAHDEMASRRHAIACLIGALRDPFDNSLSRRALRLRFGFVRQPSFGVKGRHAPGTRSGHRLAVVRIHDVPGREDPGNARVRAPGDGSEKVTGLIECKFSL